MGADEDWWFWGAGLTKKRQTPTVQQTSSVFIITTQMRDY